MSLIRALLVLLAALVAMGIVGVCILWYRFVVLEQEARAEINEGSMKLGGVRPRPRTPKPPYKPPSQKGKGKGA